MYSSLKPCVISTNYVFLKGLDGPGVLPTMQATETQVNHPIVVAVPKVGGVVGIDVFFIP